MKNIFLLICLFFAAQAAFGAVGCDLNDPDREVERLFPGSTGYKTVYLSVKTAGGEAMLSRIESRLGDNFKGLYETIDVPYTLYEVYANKKKIGYIHGVNQKGEYGGIQVFLALDLAGRIKSFYIQKLTSRAAEQLRSKAFGTQFKGLSLKEWAGYNPSGAASVANIKNPVPDSEADFRYVLRAVKKNLILLDELVFSKRPQ